MVKASILAIFDLHVKGEKRKAAVKKDRVSKAKKDQLPKLVAEEKDSEEETGEQALFFEDSSEDSDELEDPLNTPASYPF